MSSQLLDHVTDPATRQQLSEALEEIGVTAEQLFANHISTSLLRQITDSAQRKLLCEGLQSLRLKATTLFLRSVSSQLLDHVTDPATRVAGNCARVSCNMLCMINDVALTRLCVTA